MGDQAWRLSTRLVYGLQLGEVGDILLEERVPEALLGPLETTEEDLSLGGRVAIPYWWERVEGARGLRRRREVATQRS